MEGDYYTCFTVHTWEGYKFIEGDKIVVSSIAILKWKKKNGSERCRRDHGLNYPKKEEREIK